MAHAHVFDGTRTRMRTRTRTRFPCDSQEEDWVIEQEQLHHHADYTPYEGTTVHWKPEVVIARGDTLFGSHNKPTAHAVAGRGEFLPRDKYDYIAPSGRFPTPFDPFAQ